MTESRAVRRRTILKGAAWSAPVIAASSSVPSSSASVLPMLRIEAPPRMLGFLNLAVVPGAVWEDYSLTVYSGPTGTTPAPAIPVTVTLPTGLTWLDGSAGAKTFMTDSNGVVRLTGQIADPSAFSYGSAVESITIGAPGAATATVVAPVLPQGRDWQTSPTGANTLLPAPSWVTFTDGANPAMPASSLNLKATLPAGVTWADGTTTPRNLTADGNGRLDFAGQVIVGSASDSIALAYADYLITSITVGGVTHAVSSDSSAGEFPLRVV